MDVAAAPQPGTTTFTRERFTSAHEQPTRLTPARYGIGDGYPMYIGKGVAIEGSPAQQLPWGVHLAGSTFDAAVAGARQLSSMPFRPYGNSRDASTAVAILQARDGSYRMSTIWTTDFHSDHSSPVSIDQLVDLATKRRDLVAIVDQTGWLRRDGFVPTR